MNFFVTIFFLIGLSNSIYADNKSDKKIMKNQSQTIQAKEYDKIQECIKQVQKICENDQDKDCPQKKWRELPSDCKKYSDAAAYMNPDNIISGNLPGPMGDCLKQMQKLCTFDNALAEKDLDKAAKKYQTCVEAATSKLKGECKKLLNAQ